MARRRWVARRFTLPPAAATGKWSICCYRKVCAARSPLCNHDFPSSAIFDCFSVLLLLHFPVGHFRLHFPFMRQSRIRILQVRTLTSRITTATPRRRTRRDSATKIANAIFSSSNGSSGRPTSNRNSTTCLVWRISTTTPSSRCGYRGIRLETGRSRLLAMLKSIRMVNTISEFR